MTAWFQHLDSTYAKMNCFKLLLLISLLYCVSTKSYSRIKESKHVDVNDNDAKVENLEDEETTNEEDTIDEEDTTEDEDTADEEDHDEEDEEDEDLMKKIKRNTTKTITKLEHKIKKFIPLIKMKRGPVSGVQAKRRPFYYQYYRHPIPMSSELFLLFNANRNKMWFPRYGPYGSKDSS